MRFSEAWLREWVNPPVETQTLADQLSMAGLEVDAIEAAAPAFSGVVIGLVERVEPHPDAAKLRLCTVNIGAGEALQIICGAANVAAGMRVPVATIGALLPGDFRIKKVRLRGVQSFGMICSASELGLADSSEGILGLPAEAPLGEDFRAWLGLDDACIEVDLTPDRGDCLSIAGLAREVAAINRMPLSVPSIESVPALHDECVAVRLLAHEDCPRYACRVLRGIDPAAVTPLWMQERLRRSGIRSLGPVVDVTNYVMLELGQPMHAFDLARIQGGIEVRHARAGETLVLLNGNRLELREDSLIIADAERALALAGIMGGKESGVGEGTRDILLESAFFTPEAISGKARSYGLHTDSSHRFERGVDPTLQVRAIERATALLLDIVGGAPGPVLDVRSDSAPAQRASLPLRAERVAHILGLELPSETIEDILERLGMDVERSADGWRVSPPSARFDLVQEVDLIADIGRIHGYDAIPVRRAAGTIRTKALPESRVELDRVRLALVDRGYQEVITYSFVSPELQALVEPGVEALRLANPISSELSTMRTSLWPGLLNAARHNQARQQTRVRIFESGLCYRTGPNGLTQRPAIGGLWLGSVVPEQWGQAERAADFFDLKADVEALLALGGTPASFRFEPGDHSALHPGQSARILRDQVEVGRLGMLHPALAAQLDLDGNALLFELDLEALGQGTLPSYAPISRYPSIRRDIALVLDAGIDFAAVEHCIRSAGCEWLRDLVLFDVYAGENIEKGRKSLALGLILQASSQTLTDEMIDGAVSDIIDRLGSELGARLRD